MSQNDSRIVNSSRNMFYAMLSQIITILLNLISRGVFVKVLAAEYMGLSGLFSNILGLLALAELGFGSAITYSLYKPIKDENTEKIKSLMKLYKRVYWTVGIFITFIGLSLTPFIDSFLKERPDIPYLEIIFILFIIQSASTYFFSYKTNFLTASQKDYILQKYKIVFVLVQNILQIVYLIVCEEYFGFLIIGIIMPFLNNAYASYRVNKMFPYLKGPAKSLTKEDLGPIKKNVFALFFYKIAQKLSATIDTLLISKFLGIIDVAIYYNYHFLLAYSDIFFIQILGSITPSLGNLLVNSDHKHKLHVFNTLQFIYFWVATYMGIGFIVLFNTFMEIWLGKEFLFPQIIVVALAINVTITNFQRPCSLVRDAAGLFWYGKFRPIASAVINIAASVVLVQHIGIIGVIIGTIISKIATFTWYDPYIVFKHALTGSLFNYFIRYLKASVLFAGLAFLCDWLYKLVDIKGILGLFIGFVIITIVVNCFYIALYYKTSEFQYIKNNLIYKVLRK